MVSREVLEVSSIGSEPREKTIWVWEKLFWNGGLTLPSE